MLQAALAKSKQALAASLWRARDGGAESPRAEQPRPKVSRSVAREATAAASGGGVAAAGGGGGLRLICGGVAAHCGGVNVLGRHYINLDTPFFLFPLTLIYFAPLLENSH